MLAAGIQVVRVAEFAWNKFEPRGGEYDFAFFDEFLELAKEKGCESKIIIGGACITESFAQEIGADGYSADAASCVKLVQKLLG